PQPSRMGRPRQDPSAQVEQRAQQNGVVKWYRWKSGGLSLFLGVDGGGVARVAATIRIMGMLESWKITSGSAGNLAAQ
ncbi:MAG TPA: hypothetical protein VFA26_07880, partial [Gemmataceae bacterium]|nr:hypothetical protein [Gemmataceae bacterium]